MCVLVLIEHFDLQYCMRGYTTQHDAISKSESSAARTGIGNTTIASALLS